MGAHMLSVVGLGKDAGGFCHELLEVSSVTSCVGEGLVPVLDTDTYRKYGS